MGLEFDGTPGVSSLNLRPAPSPAPSANCSLYPTYALPVRTHTRTTLSRHTRTVTHPSIARTPREHRRAGRAVCRRGQGAGRAHDRAQPRAPVPYEGKDVHSPEARCKPAPFERALRVPRNFLASACPSWRQGCAALSPSRGCRCSAPNVFDTLHPTTGRHTVQQLLATPTYPVYFVQQGGIIFSNQATTVSPTDLTYNLHALDTRFTPRTTGRHHLQQPGDHGVAHLRN